ncbi:MAG: hypothetical protein AAF412_03035 [Pseudomonadota bacterium]
MLEDYNAKSGRLERVFTLEIQTLEDEVDRILDAVMAVNPLLYGRYERNASVMTGGKETTRPQANSTTTTHKEDYEHGKAMTYPMIELKISVERDLAVLEAIMDVILDLHHYEQPVIFVREDWASRANYDPKNENPNRWWNNGRGLPEEVPLGANE